MQRAIEEMHGFADETPVTLWGSGGMTRKQKGEPKRANSTRWPVGFGRAIVRLLMDAASKKNGPARDVEAPTRTVRDEPTKG